MGIRGRCVPREFADRSGLRALRGLVLLEHDDARALAHDEPVQVPVERREAESG